VIRAIQPSDKAQWARLFVAYGVFYETAFTQEIVDAVFAKLVDDSPEIEGVVATLDDRLVGFALYRRLYDTFTAGPGWHLDDLYVDPSARGQGVATDLIEAVTIIARENGGGTVRWITAADNTTAQSVYDKVAVRKTWVTYEKES
jgi:ribosomal protein S18 acetylase RimI-like enzyme